MGYVFVGGSPRSGTTMLQLLLCQDKTTNPYVYEATYIRPLIELYQKTLQSYNSELPHLRHYFSDDADIRDFHATQLIAFLTRTQQRLGGSNLVLKEPQLTVLFPILFDLVPSAKFILIVRDPRDCIASMLTVGQKMMRENMEHFYQNRDMQALCNHYKSFYMPTLNSKNMDFKKQVIAVRYEDVIQETTEVKQQLSRFTGIPLVDIDGKNNFDTGKTDFQALTDRNKTWITDLYGQNVNDRSIGAYVNVLTKTEIASIEDMCGDAMTIFNYKPSVENAL